MHVPTVPKSSIYPRDLLSLADIIKKKLTKEETEILNTVSNVDWEHEHLNLANSKDRFFAATALSLGVPVFHGFGNFYALTFHPHLEVMRSVNAAKGRPLDQIASVTTTKNYLAELFDWDQLPQGFTKKKILSLMDAFYTLGPFGFRGPAAKQVFSHLTKEIEGRKTIQVIAPGYHCLSNELLEEALALTHIPYFAATSPNISRNITGAEEPAHYKIAGIKKDFGNVAPGFVMVGHADEEEVIKNYPHHDVMSTSIISFDTPFGDQPKVIIERHGSLPMEEITALLDSFGIAWTIGLHAEKRLLKRVYSI